MTTATANQMSATPTAGPTGEVDGPAPVASPVAPTARIIEVGDDRWFVHSNTVAGCWWKVDLIPGESLTCSCPAGLRAGTDLSARPCRHIRGVVDRMEKAAAAAKAVA